jgi:hypothetical protein
VPAAIDATPNQPERKALSRLEANSGFVLALLSTNGPLYQIPIIMVSIGILFVKDLIMIGTEMESLAWDDTANLI